MRLVVSLMCLGLLSVGGAARAQQPYDPAPASQQVAPPPPSDAPVHPASPVTEPAPTRLAQREYQGPAETPAERAMRYSRFSSGSGGVLLVFTELISGLTTGAILGNSLDTKNGTYLGGVIGGLTLGTAAAIYQYYVPVERNESLLASAGAALGFLAGYGYGTAQGIDAKDRAVAALITTQLGIVGVLAATARPGDVSDGDAGLVGMSALYAFAATGLIQSSVALASGGDKDINLAPTLVAPLIGMGIGGLLAIPFELAPRRVFQLTAIPLGVGAVMLGAGTLLADGPAVPLSALGGVAASFVITLLVTADDAMPYPPSRPGARLRSSSRAEPLKAVPVPVFMRSGERGDRVTAGPGMFLRF